MNRSDYIESYNVYIDLQEDAELQLLLMPMTYEQMAEFNELLFLDESLIFVRVARTYRNEEDDIMYMTSLMCWRDFIYYWDGVSEASFRPMSPTYGAFFRDYLAKEPEADATRP